MEEYCLSTESPLFKKTLEYCEKVADSDANVLLIGESGTGKEVAARYIHRLSKRRSKSFVAVNCSAFTESLLESELFGHEQGSFTGATRSRIGKIHSANEGTLFLDEIGDTNPATQIKLLRVIESKHIERIGSDIPSYIDFRLISATNKDLHEAIRSTIFREDFFYRISTVVIRIPALRERKEDLHNLITFFINKSQEDNRKIIRDMVPEARQFLYEYHYPGNIRELKNIIDRMVILSEDGIVTRDCLPILYSMSKEPAEKKEEVKAESKSFYLPGEILPFSDFKRISETQYLSFVLRQTGGNAAEAARRLKISTRQLFNKIRQYGIQR